MEKIDIYKERIKPLFENSGLTVRELAKELGIPEKQIYNWNAGLAHSYRNGKYLEKISSYFGVSIGYLLGQDNAFVLVRKKRDEKTPVPPTENGLSEKAREAATLFDRAEPWMQEQILSLLRAAESSRAVQGDAPKDK